MTIAKRMFKETVPETDYTSWDDFESSSDRLADNDIKRETYIKKAIKYIRSHRKDLAKDVRFYRECQDIFVLLHEDRWDEHSTKLADLFDNYYPDWIDDPNFPKWVPVNY
jgi:hypothetical protein